MLKSLLLVSGLIVFGSTAAMNLSPKPDPGGSAQEAAPVQAPAVPSSTVKNPVTATVESQAYAKKMYGYDCVMCHGATGTGKTDLAKDMNLTLSDWSNPKALDGKSDGDLFAVIRKGKEKMPAEDDSRAKDDTVWNLVIYIRGMSKGAARLRRPAGIDPDSPVLTWLS